MNEIQIKKGNLKISVFKEFPFDELSKIVNKITPMGYTATIIENGNIVLQKIEDDE